MVIATHIILTGYAHWLPNDPRGSMSPKTYTSEIARFAEDHFGPKSIQPSMPELKKFYRQVQPHLAHQVLWFGAAHRQRIADAFGACVQREGLTCYACAIMPDHVHLLIRRHRMAAREVSCMLKHAGREALCEDGLAPPDHPVFSADSCHIYKSDTRAMWTCVRYIGHNFEKHRIAKPDYPFVTPYDNWPFHKRGSDRNP